MTSSTPPLNNSSGETEDATRLNGIVLASHLGVGGLACEGQERSTTPCWANMCGPSSTTPKNSGFVCSQPNISLMRTFSRQAYQGTVLTLGDLSYKLLKCSNQDTLCVLARETCHCGTKKWLHRGRLCDLLPYIDTHDTHLKIADIYHNGVWHFERLYTQLPLDIKLDIQSVYLNYLSPNILIWNHAPNGTYSAKSAYVWLIRDLLVNPEPTGWTWIWKLKIPENVRHFVWLTMHESLPTNEFRVQRHISFDGSCQRCGSQRETILHALHDCPRVQTIWNILGFSRSDLFLTNDVSNWLKSHATTENGCLFVICCWFLWKSRNSEIFSDFRWPTWRILNQTHSLVASSIKAVGGQVSGRGARMVKWHPPPPNSIKINVDGSSYGNPGRAGFGGLLRNSVGEWLIGYSGCCGIATNINAELQAIEHGLRLAWEEGH